jgi:hypothetical protein
MVDREDHGVALPERHDVGSRLHSRPLLGHDKLATGEVHARLREQ